MHRKKFAEYEQNRAHFFDKNKKAEYNLPEDKLIRILQGRVKFPTGGKAHEQQCKSKAADSVKFRSRRSESGGEKFICCVFVFLASQNFLRYLFCIRELSLMRFDF